MTARDTYHTSVVAATATAVAGQLANAGTCQAAIDAVGTTAGNPPGRGLSAANILTVQNAARAYAYNKNQTAMAQQVAIDVAKDVLRNSGDNAPA